MSDKHDISIAKLDKLFKSAELIEWWNKTVVEDDKGSLVDPAYTLSVFFRKFIELRAKLAKEYDKIIFDEIKEGTLTQDEAANQGYTIDRQANCAYKGPRFAPTDLKDTFTPLEAKLLDIVGRFINTDWIEHAM